MEQWDATDSCQHNLGACKMPAAEASTISIPILSVNPLGPQSKMKYNIYGALRILL